VSVLLAQMRSTNRVDKCPGSGAKRKVSTREEDHTIVRVEARK
jgi:hypothetical protein